MRLIAGVGKQSQFGLVGFNSGLVRLIDVTDRFNPYVIVWFQFRFGAIDRKANRITSLPFW